MVSSCFISESPKNLGKGTQKSFPPSNSILLSSVGQTIRNMHITYLFFRLIFHGITSVEWHTARLSRYVTVQCCHKDVIKFCKLMVHPGH